MFLASPHQDPHLGNKYEPNQNGHSKLNSEELQQVNHIRSRQVPNEKPAINHREKGFSNPSAKRCQLQVK